MPADYPEFPSGQQIHDYLTAYATHFGFIDRIRVGCEVIAIAARSDGAAGWSVEVRDTSSGATKSTDYDFVVICNGVFSEPKIPSFPGREQFERNGGVCVHSTGLHDLQQIAGGSVAVVGFGKSALDLAEACASVAQSVSIIARRIPWKVPHRFWGKLHVKYFVLSRFSELWYRRPDDHGLRRFLLAPFAALYWRTAEWLISRQLGLTTPALRPNTLLQRTGNCVTIAPDDLKAIRQGRVKLHRGQVTRFTADGLELDTGETIGAQTVILATGFHQDCPFLPERERRALTRRGGEFLLYRLLVNPEIPNMAFNGYNGIGSCQLTAEVGAVWLTQFVEQTIAVPGKEEMRRQIHGELELRRALFDVSHGNGFYASPLTLTYLDQLLDDLGLPPADQHRGFFGRLFRPIDPRDYRDLLTRRAG